MTTSTKGENRPRNGKAGVNLLLTFLIASVIVVAACTSQEQQPQQQAECRSDTDCGAGGCSGQVCTTAAEAGRIITTCEYRPEYDCLKLTSCGCVEGKCGWKENADYKTCFENAKLQPKQ